MAWVTRSRQGKVHPVFRGVVENWLARADALSALPDAPVVPDEPRRRRPVAWLRVRRQPVRAPRSTAAPTAATATPIRAGARFGSSAESPLC